MRTLKSTPLALTVGSQTWVRKVLREIGVPTLVVNSRSFRAIDLVRICAALRPARPDGRRMSEARCSSGTASQ
jgi:hypothetical protein